MSASWQGAGSISVIIVNLNGRALLGECLSSVAAQETPAAQILLVDNGSTDDSVPFVRQAFPEVQIIEAGSNLGFAGGNNVALAQIIGRSDAPIMLLNRILPT